MNLGGSVKFNKCAVATLVSAVIFIIYIFSSTSSTTRMLKTEINNYGKINLRKLLIGLIIAAQQGGDEVLKVSRQENFGQKSKGKTKEGVDDPVTEADKNSHCVIALGLARIFGHKLNMISEEVVDDSTCPKRDEFFDLDPSVLGGRADLPDVYVSPSDITVWIDPLDATKEFTEKLFHYVSVMICVALKGTPVMGIVHFPFENKHYWAWSGVQRSENLDDVHADFNENVKSPIVIVSRSHSGEVYKLAKKQFGEKVKVIHAAGSGYKIIQVLKGNATIYLHNTFIKKWDLCAGNAIVKAVKGRMQTLKGEDISYESGTDPLVTDGLQVEINKNVIV